LSSGIIGLICWTKSTNTTNYIVSLVANTLVEVVIKVLVNRAGLTNVINHIITGIADAFELKRVKVGIDLARLACIIDKKVAIIANALTID
jgi:hypothetical protein